MTPTEPPRNRRGTNVPRPYHRSGLHAVSRTLPQLLERVTERTRRGLSVRALGEKSGVPYPSIQRIEAGRLSLTLATLEKLARALGVTNQ